MNGDKALNIGPLVMPTRIQHAEANGCQVIASTALPEPVMHALVALVDALSAAARDTDAAERAADAARTRRPCPSHLGQYADYCGPCRSEQIAAIG